MKNLKSFLFSIYILTFTTPTWSLPYGSQNIRLAGSPSISNGTLNNSDLIKTLQVLFAQATERDRNLIRSQKDISIFATLAPLKDKILQALSQDPGFAGVLQEAVERYAVEMMRAMPATFIVNRIYPSLTAHLLIGLIEESLGRTTETARLSTMDVVRDNDSITPIAVGTHSLGPQSFRHPMGFYYIIFKAERATSELQTLYYQWTHQGKNFNAALKIKLGTAEQAVGNWKNPVQSLRSDRQLVGMAWISPNVRDDIPMVLGRYIAYLEDQGFHIDASRSDRTWNLSEIKNLFVHGKVDYLVKEAHSDGDLVNMFQLGKNSKVIVATKSGNGDLSGETFYILLPEKRDSSLGGSEKFGVPPRVVGEWMKSRSEITTTPLIYLNSSCWSIKKVFTEITQVSDPHFINIPSLDSVAFFNNQGANHMRTFIDGIRQGLEFSAIEQNLIHLDYQGQGWSKPTRFVFPNSRAYFSQITQKLGHFVDYDLQVL